VCRFALKSWAAQDSLLRTIVENLYEKWQADATFHPWENYVHEGQELLQGQQVTTTAAAAATYHYYYYYYIPLTASFPGQPG